jgi:hypothetical protein
MLIRIASPVLGPNVLAVLRIGMATLTLAVLMRVMRHAWPSGHWRELALIGLLSVALPFLLFAWAALHLPAGYSALLNSTAVVFGMFASAWMKEDTLTLRKVIGCVCGFSGVALIVGLGPVEPSAKVFLAALGCVAASACYGVSTPLMKRALGRMEPLQIDGGGRHGRCHFRHCLLDAYPHPGTCLTRGGHEPNLHDSGFRCYLGPPFPGRTARRWHFCRWRAGAIGQRTDYRIQPLAEMAGRGGRQTLRL